MNIFSRSGDKNAEPGRATSVVPQHMLLLHEASAAAPGVQRSDLVHLQLEIARRADELARIFAAQRPSDLDLWLQSEQEVFARHLNQPKIAPLGNSNQPFPLVGHLDAQKTREWAKLVEG